MNCSLAGETRFPKTRRAENSFQPSTCFYISDTRAGQDSLEEGSSSTGKLGRAASVGGSSRRPGSKEDSPGRGKEPEQRPGSDMDMHCGGV